MAVQFSVVKLSFATRLSGGKFNHLFIARVPYYLHLKIMSYYNAIFS
jgi:hypothetical protein